MSIRRILAGLRRSRGSVCARGTRELPCGTLECPCCRAEFLCPIDWERVDDAGWWIRLRCGECGMRLEAPMTNAQVARLDEELDRQCSAIHRALMGLEAERMAAEAEAFIAALRSDLIVAADFA